MSVTRRKFLNSLLYAPGALALSRTVASAQQPTASTNAPEMTNHNASGRAEVIEGQTLLVTLRFRAPVGQLSGSFPVELETGSGQRFTETQELYFYPVGDDGRVFRTILSAPLDAVEGRYNIRLSARGERGGAAGGSWTIPYTVRPGVYRSSVITFSREFTEPSPETQARMRRDFEEMAQTYRARTPRRWRQEFIRPTTVRDLNNFGMRRTANQTRRYRHAGLDYLAPIGTPIRAINDGTVVLSTEHWVAGLLVCLDHGGGVFSRYIHLSEQRVRAGETVRRGQLIALSGRSGGQNAGPHLHMDMVVNSAAVSPEDFRRTAARLLALEGSTPENTRPRR